MMDLQTDSVWCECHGCIHEKTDDPYRYEYKLSGEKPECGEQDWRKVWVGALFVPEKK